MRCLPGAHFRQVPIPVRGGHAAVHEESLPVDEPAFRAQEQRPDRSDLVRHAGAGRRGPSIVRR